MTGDVRSLQVAVPETFDFNSQAGILFILRAIRVAPIDQAVKNTLKDLVFLYNTGGKDVTLKQKLEQALIDQAVTPLVVVEAEAVLAIEKTPAPVVPVSGFSGGRLAPVFGTTEVTAPPYVSSSQPSVSQPEVTPVEKNSNVNLSDNTSIPIRKIAPAIPLPPREAVRVEPVPSIVKVPVPAPVIVSDQAPVDVVVPIKQTVPTPVVAPVIPVAPHVEVAPVAPRAVESAASDEAMTRMERIRTIKSTVNERIGNPVNLVDVDNALGREYMSALLEAMKLLSSASPEESTRAMTRLETVYVQVLTLLDSLDQKNKPVVEITAPAASLGVAAITPIVPVITPVVVPAPALEPVAATPVPPVEQVTPVAVERLVPVAPAVPAPSSDFVFRSKVVDKPQSAPAVSGWETTATPSVTQTVSPVEVVASVAQVVTQPDVTTVHRMSTPPAEPLRAVQQPATMGVPSYQPEAVQSVVEQAAPLRSLSELKTADEVSAIEAMQNNPLYTKDVDAGLEQLLGEWSIFKKSGLFGTGPKGREHPLYVKINGMHLPLILAGRFEGSTQEIKQSITDYMNGWRYEQGIVYDQGETLDQYLRRVIRHIIDLQKSKRRP